MSFITEESGICLSPTGGSAPRGCGPLINEIGDKYVLTEEPKRILLDGECGVKTDFNCQEVDRQTVDSGKFVTLVNVCNLPLNITGLKNSDPDRFSIFKFPDYSGFSEYNTDNSAELPIKLQPFERININTFFHPLHEELMNGNAGSVESRTGDSFSADICMFPGFEIVNCPGENEGGDDYCSACFTLSGEFVCYGGAALDWMNDDENFIPPIIEQEIIVNDAPVLNKLPTSETS